jgi:hypothetical protein
MTTTELPTTDLPTTELPTTGSLRIRSRWSPMYYWALCRALRFGLRCLIPVYVLLVTASGDRRRSARHGCGSSHPLSLDTFRTV